MNTNIVNHINPELRCPRLINSFFYLRGSAPVIRKANSTNIANIQQSYTQEQNQVVANPTWVSQASSFRDRK
jgi:hypothetical protein